MTSKILRYCFSAIFVFCGAVSVFAQNSVIGQDLDEKFNVITTGVPFLTIAPDSRAGAMGNAGVASSPDANSIYWNPSKYAFIDKQLAVNFSYIPWLRNLVKDINFQNLSAAYKIDKKQAVGLSLMYFSLGEISFTGVQGTKIMDFKPNEFSIDAAYALKLSEYLSGGVAFRYVHSNLTGKIPVAGSGSPTRPGNAFAGDISFYFTKPFTVQEKESNLSAGINISNLGSKISYSKDSYYEDFLPANLRLGLAYKLHIDDYNSLTAMLDVNKLLVPTPPRYIRDSSGNVTDTIGKDPRVSVPVALFQSFYDAPGGAKEEFHEIMYSGGLEYWYMEKFALRAGYFHEHDSKGGRKFFTLGVGLRLNVLNFDFAYVIPTVGKQNPLANTLRFTLGINIKKIGEK